MIKVSIIPQKKEAHGNGGLTWRKWASAYRASFPKPGRKDKVQVYIATLLTAQRDEAKAQIEKRKQ